MTIDEKNHERGAHDSVLKWCRSGARHPKSRSQAVHYVMRIGNDGACKVVDVAGYDCPILCVAPTWADVAANLIAAGVVLS